MNVIGLLFTLVAFTLAKAMILSEANPDQIEFPTLEIPSRDDFIDLSGGCSGFFDCTEYLANVVFNIGVGVIFSFSLLFNLIIFVFELVVFIFTVAFTGIEDAPDFVNILLAIPYVGGLGFIVYKMFRSGSTNA